MLGSAKPFAVDLRSRATRLLLRRVEPAATLLTGTVLGVIPHQGSAHRELHKWFIQINLYSFRLDRGLLARTTDPAVSFYIIDNFYD